jgi:formylmethanofuran dehydrogenase subunit B
MRLLSGRGLTTATYGINTGGTVYRMDDVPIPLRPAFASPYPTDEDVLKKLRSGSGSCSACRFSQSQT